MKAILYISKLFSPKATILLFFISLSFAFIPLNVYATSVYDNSIIDHHDSALTITNGTAEATVSNIYDYIETACSTNTADIYQYDLENGYSYVGNVPDDNNLWIYGTSSKNTANLGFYYGSMLGFTLNASTQHTLIQVILNLDGTFTCSIGTVTNSDTMYGTLPANVLENTFPVSYPSGYEGSNIDNLIFSTTPVAEDVYPHVLYTINKTHLEAYTIPFEGTTQISGIDYSVYDSTNTDELFNFGWDNGELHKFNYDFSSPGIYFLHVTYRIPSVIDPDTYNNITTEIEMTVTGSSEIFVPPTNQTCTIENGVNSCDTTTEDPLYEDCASFTEDFAGALTCTFGNFMLNIKNFFVWLLIPDTKFITDLTDSYAQSSFGLEAIIAYPLDLIADLSTGTCSAIVLPLPFVDEDLTLPCMYPIYDENFGDLIDFYQLIVNGIVSYWIIVKLLAMVKQFNDPKENKIEVLDL